MLIESVCCSGQRCSDSGKRKHFRFRLIKKYGLHIDTNRVRVDGIYLHEYYSSALKRNEYTFYRFFDNGRVYTSSVYCSKPTEVQLNELGYGWYGNYRVDSNRITEETYTAWAGYYIQYATITGDSIKLVSTKTRGRKINKGKELWCPGSTYVFQSCKLTSLTSW